MLTINLHCTRCEKQFQVALDVYRTLEFSTLPKRCPTCCDEIQGRPDVVLDRTTISEYICRVDQSFARFFDRAIEFKPIPTDSGSRRLTLKGSDYGAQWSGRVDLYSHLWPVSAGDVVTVTHNAVKRRVWYVKTERRTVFDTRTWTTTRRVPQSYSPIAGESEVGQREEVNEYLLLSRNLDSTAAMLQRDALPTLCFLEAYSKETLKGLGRQFRRRIEGEPLAAWSVSGGCRSGRYGTHAMIAVVDPLDPLHVVGVGDLADLNTTVPA